MDTARIFVSYSHRGNGPEWKAVLLGALEVFERHHLLDVWQDGNIRVGSFWDDDIRCAIADASLAVVLLTREALESEFILEVEFPALRERQHRGELLVYPVICDECDWRSQDWLRAIQAANESRPLSQLAKSILEKVFRRLAADIATDLGRCALADLANATLPLTPIRVYFDKFPLIRGAGVREDKLVGREQELALLDLAFAQPRTAIVSLVAWGGVGKTILVRHWLQRLQREGWFGARRVYGWSFYSQGTNEDRQASEDAFLAHALDWFGVVCEPTLSALDKGRLLADAVCAERTLLVLDGIEPLQYPPGPRGGQIRAAGLQSLLKHLARRSGDGAQGSLCLITTREPLTDLSRFERRPNAAWGGVLRVDLANLADEAGAALLHHVGARRAGAAGIKPDDAELVAASREVDGHALTLNLLGRFLGRAHAGDIRRRALVGFEEADRLEQGGSTFKMLAAFETWFSRSGEFGARQLAILRVLGLFDRPADPSCMRTLRNPPPINGITSPLFIERFDAGSGHRVLQPLVDEDWNIAIAFLTDFGLVEMQSVAQNDNLLLDSHPLVREYFSQLIRRRLTDGWRSAHRRLYEHLKGSVEDKPDSLDGIEVLYEAVSHGCDGGLYEEAREDVLDNRIRRGVSLYSLKQFDVFDTHLSTISHFFAKPWTKLIQDIHGDSQPWLLNEAGYCLRALGRLGEAVEPMRLAAELSANLEDYPESAKYISNVSEALLELGDPERAAHFAQQAIHVGTTEQREIEANHVIAIGSYGYDWRARRRDLAVLGSALHQAGLLAESHRYFREAELIQARHQSQFSQLYSIIGFRFADFLQSELERTSWRIQITSRSRYFMSIADAGHLRTLSSLCRETQRRGENSLQLVLQGSRNALDIALNTLTLGRVSLYGKIIGFGDYENSDEVKLLVEADKGLRRSGAAHHIPRGLLSLAWARFRTGDIEGARFGLDEAWDIAERGPMRLHLADIYLQRARLFFREAVYPWESAHADLAEAEKLISECGYHRRDVELADAKNAILRQ